MLKTTVYQVADAFLTMEPMSHKKLQKLCYYAYSWHLTLTGNRLFENNFQAWVHGPVDPGLYQVYREYGWQMIPQRDAVEMDTDTFAFVKQVYDSYGHLDGDQLEYLTHKEDPWVKARGGLPEYAPCHNRIQDEEIREFYLKAYEDGQND